MKKVKEIKKEEAIDYNQELREYARSKEALQLKIKDDFNNELMNMKTEKTSLI